MLLGPSYCSWYAKGLEASEEDPDIHIHGTSGWVVTAFSPTGDDKKLTNLNLKSMMSKCEWRGTDERRENTKIRTYDK